jgi:hypothetical protein
VLVPRTEYTVAPPVLREYPTNEMDVFAPPDIAAAVPAETSPFHSDPVTLRPHASYRFISATGVPSGTNYINTVIQEISPGILLDVVRHPRRDELKEYLEAHQIGCALHYPVPLHLQNCYRSLGCQAGNFPVAEKVARECLSLPIYPELTDEQIERVAAVIHDFFRK